MKNPVALAACHVRLPGASATAWGIELVLQLHGRVQAGRQPLQRGHGRKTEDFDAGLLTGLRKQGIATRVVSYGTDFARFEAELTREWREPGGFRFPLIRVPSSAITTWADAGLHVRPCTLLTGGTRERPVFLLREAGGSNTVKLGLSQMRNLHAAWSAWPALLPSALLTVLWHRPA